MEGHLLITAKNHKERSAEVIKVDIQGGIDQARVVHRIQIKSENDYYVSSPFPRSVLFENMLYYLVVNYGISLVQINATTLQIIQQDKFNIPDSVVEKSKYYNGHVGVEVFHLGIVKNDFDNCVAMVHNSK